MPLDTPAYLLFLTIVFLLYYALEPGTPRRTLLLIASYYFYIELSNVYISVLFLVTGLTYYGALALRSPKRRQNSSLFFTLLITLVLIPLLVFKYLGPSLDLVSGFWRNSHPLPSGFMSLALPIGISFFTFAALGYLTDVYLEVVEPESSLLRVALFLAFFPLVSAGPIERAGRFISQFELDKKFSANRALSALRLIFIGLVLKVLFAERLETMADSVMESPHDWRPIELWLGMIHYTFFIYADFAGYSLIAIGSAKLLGLDVRPNFHEPFLSSTIPEFWRNWHISLSSWVRDYVFVPLRTEWRQFQQWGFSAALLLSFGIIGIWHGAKWGYFAFGVMHGILVVGSTLTLSHRDAFWKAVGITPENLYFPRVIITFILVVLVFVVFRANTINDAIYVYRQLFSMGMVRDCLHVASSMFWRRGEPFISANLLTAKSWMIIFVILVGDIMVRKKMTLERFPPLAQFGIYTFGLMELLAAWIDVYVPHPFVYNKF